MDYCDENQPFSPNFPECWGTVLLDNSGERYIDLRPGPSHFHHTSISCPNVLSGEALSVYNEKDEETDKRIRNLLNCEIGMLDADVYSGFVSPGHHSLPKEMVELRPAYLLVSYQPWFSDETIMLDDGSSVSKDQKLEVKQLSVKKKMTPHLDSQDSSLLARQCFSGAVGRMEELIKADTPYPELLMFNIGAKDVSEIISTDRTEITYTVYCVKVPYIEESWIESQIGFRQKIDRKRRLKEQSLSSKVERFRQLAVVKKDDREIRALSTFRDLVTEKEFRRYLTNGFHVVKGSDCWYQVFNNQREVVVWKNNKKFATICIHTDRKCPPTDHILNCMYLIKFDENQFWRLGNIRSCNNIRELMVRTGEMVYV